MTTPAIKAAQARLQAAQEAVSQAEAELLSRKKAATQASTGLTAAYLERDKDIPRARIKRLDRFAKSTSESEVCIIKQTEKTVFVRAPGSQDEKGRQFRQSNGGEWCPYPAPKRRMWDSSREVLILPKCQS